MYTTLILYRERVIVCTTQVYNISGVCIVCMSVILKHATHLISVKHHEMRNFPMATEMDS